MTSGDPSPPSLPPIHLRFSLVGLILLLLSSGTWAGLRRIGWDLGITSEHYLNQHGPIMISGFLGSAIAAERALALSAFDRKPRSKLRGLLRCLIPLLSISGSLMLLWPGSAWLGRWIIAGSSLGLLALMLRILDFNPSLYTLLMAFGAAGWAFGNLLWLGGIHFPALLPSWAMFVILTVAGERFELLRIQPANRIMSGAFYAGGGLVIAGALLAPLNSNLAVRSSGLGALILALWLLIFDVARSSIGMTGLSRYSALTVLTSFSWLGVYGLMALRVGFVPTGTVYDALAHSLLIGFALGMMLANAPFIAPALLGRKAVYHSWLMNLAIGFHVSLALRVIADLTQWRAGWQWGSLLLAIFGFLFVLLLLYALWTARHTD